jgi:hypothetical protein
MLSGVNYCRGVEDLSTLRGWAEVMPRRDRGEHDDARSGGNYRVALSGCFWPESFKKSPDLAGLVKKSSARIHLFRDLGG